MKILIADDHELFRTGVGRILTDLVDDVVVVEAGDLEEARKAAAENPDLEVILLDLKMPGVEGLSGVRLLSEEAPDALLVVVSASESQDDVREAIRCGAAGFIPKTSSAPVMISALRLILAGGVYLPPSLLAEDPSPNAGEAATPALSARQQEVLLLLAQGRSNKEIARELTMSISAVKLHVSAVLKKLAVNNRTEAATAAGRLGLLPPG